MSYTPSGRQVQDPDPPGRSHHGVPRVPPAVPCAAPRGNDEKPAFRFGATLPAWPCAAPSALPAVPCAVPHGDDEAPAFWFGATPPARPCDVPRAPPVALCATPPVPPAARGLVPSAAPEPSAAPALPVAASPATFVFGPPKPTAAPPEPCVVGRDDGEKSTFSFGSLGPCAPTPNSYPTGLGLGSEMPEPPLPPPPPEGNEACGLCGSVNGYNYLCLSCMNRKRALGERQECQSPPPPACTKCGPVRTGYCGVWPLWPPRLFWEPWLPELDG